MGAVVVDITAPPSCHVSVAIVADTSRVGRNPVHSQAPMVLTMVC